MAMLDHDTIAKMLLEETDRGVVLLSFALIEAELDDLFVKKLAHGKEKHVEDLPTHHLGSVATRTLVARRSGWLPEDVCDLVDSVRKIRNHIAHNPTESLGHSKIRKHLSDPRWRFTPGVVTERDKILVMVALAHSAIGSVASGFEDACALIRNSKELVAPEFLSTGSYGGMHWPPA
jgi:hypothetical protein